MTNLSPRRSSATIVALLRRPRILVSFDEATASLDHETAEACARTVSRLRGSATVLFIAHHVPEGLAADAVARIEPRRSGVERIDLRQQRCAT